MKFSDVSTFVTAGLTAKGYNPLPVLLPGPAANTNLQQTSPNAIVFLGLGGGPGLSTEELIDGTFIHVRAIGTQDDYAYAEQLADDIDKMLLAVDRNATVGEAFTLFVNRAGGPPALIELDSAQRYHFTCDYIASVSSGI